MSSSVDVTPHGLSFLSRFASGDPFESIDWDYRKASIKDDKGAVVFEMPGVRVPKAWSQRATDILASKYCRKAEVPKLSGGDDKGREHDAEQVVTRIALAVRAAGVKAGGYFATDADAQRFQSDLSWLLIHQHAAFNSPVWFNLGLKESYGITGEAAGTWAWNPKTGDVELAKDGYSRPQVSACFIRGVKDDLMHIFDGVKEEARLFKFGSGVGSNFSALRAENEPLKNGGTSSGLMSWLEIYDRAAGAIKSGGTTRRAAKGVWLDADHPDVWKFVEWKAREEDKARALCGAGFGTPGDINSEALRTVSGQNANNSVRVTDEFMRLVESGGDWSTRLRTSGAVAQTFPAKKLWDRIAEVAWACADPGVQFHTTINRWHTCPNTAPILGANPCVPGETKIRTRDGDLRIDSLVGKTVDVWNGIEWSSVVPQVTGRDQPMVRVVLSDGRSLRCTEAHRWRLQEDTTHVVEKEARAVDLKEGDVLAAYRTGPDGPRQKAHVVLVEPAGREDVVYCFKDHKNGTGTFDGIVTGQCAEYHFLDDTACNLASMNLVKFLRDDGTFDVQRFMDAVRVVFVAMEILVDHASYPSRLIALNSHDYRPLGIGYANLGALLMRLGHPYDSTEGRALAAAITSILTGHAYEVSAEMAASKGPFNGFDKNREPMLRVMGQHLEATRKIESEWGSSGCIGLIDVAERTWSRAISKGEKHGFRNAQASVLAPTGTIGLLMDCDTMGVEPEFALTKEKKLAGGGTMTIVNQSVEHAFRRLGYDDNHVRGAFDRMATGWKIRDVVKPEHVAVFACAVGDDAISPLGHVAMIQAVQPFISGSISKTVNLPAESTVADVANAYMDAWRRGLKVISVYRDGSKSAQPLSAAKGEPEGKVAPEKAPARAHLPKKRKGFTIKLRVGGQKFYLRTGEYEDGKLGEIFVDLAKEGSTMRSLMNTFAISLSIGLQHGVPLEEYVDAFAHARFEPCGPVDHEVIKSASSVPDAIVRILEYEYLGKTETASAVDEDDSKDAVVFKTAAKTSRADAPFCTQCGHLTRRTGNCHVCGNCGTSAGCS